MARVTPDSNDVIVWLLNETSTPFINSSTSVSTKGTQADLVTVQGTLVTDCLGPFDPDSRGLGIVTYLASSTYNTDVPAVVNGTWDFVSNAVASGSAVDVPAPMTVSGWIKFNIHVAGAFVLMKRLAPSSWNSPYTALEIKVIDTSGTLRFGITTPPNTQSTATAATTEFAAPLGVWCHVGMTYDGSTLKGYLNGELVATANVVSVIDFGTSGPWAFGSAAGGGVRYEPSCILADWRVANIARGLSYFRQVYTLGIRV